jgi:hypothetical protein
MTATDATPGQGHVVPDMAKARFSHFDIMEM